jgi:short-subunit dehydrogenase
VSEGRALITGASAGLGAEFARQLARQGHDLILVARRTELMQALARSLIDDYNVLIDVIQADLSDPMSTSLLKDEVTRRGLTVNFLINNAGSVGPDLLDDRDWPAQQKYIELMMTSVAGLCHHFIPGMKERGYGRVVNVASVAGYLSVTGDTSYGPTKAYLISLSKNLAKTLRGSGVNVLALCPGFTHTDFHHQSERLKKMKRSTPAFIWYDAELVVREGLVALEKGKDVYISGRLYRFVVPLLRTRIADWLIKLVGFKRDY